MVKRCPNGTRRNKKTGKCERKKRRLRSNSKRVRRCPNGFRRIPPKTGSCQKYKKGKSRVTPIRRGMGVSSGTSPGTSPGASPGTSPGASPGTFSKEEVSTIRKAWNKLPAYKKDTRKYREIQKEINSYLQNSLLMYQYGEIEGANKLQKELLESQAKFIQEYERELKAEKIEKIMKSKKFLDLQKRIHELYALSRPGKPDPLLDAEKVKIRRELANMFDPDKILSRKSGTSRRR